MARNTTHYEQHTKQGRYMKKYRIW